MAVVAKEPSTSGDLKISLKLPRPMKTGSGVCRSLRVNANPSARRNGRAMTSAKARRAGRRKSHPIRFSPAFRPPRRAWAETRMAGPGCNPPRATVAEPMDAMVPSTALGHGGFHARLHAGDGLIRSLLAENGGLELLAENRIEFRRVGPDADLVHERYPCRLGPGLEEGIVLHGRSPAARLGGRQGGERR